MTYKRGDIIDVPFLFSDLTQTKFRPALVLNDDHAIVVSDTTRNPTAREVVIAQITSTANVAHSSNLTCVLVPLDGPLATGTNLLSDSFIVTERLATIETDLIRKKRGFFSYMGLVDDALRAALAL